MHVVKLSVVFSSIEVEAVDIGFAFLGQGFFANSSQSNCSPTLNQTYAKLWAPIFLSTTIPSSIFLSVRGSKDMLNWKYRVNEKRVGEIYKCL